MLLRITQYGEAVLRQVGEPVQEFGPELRQLVADMIETMEAADGLGLAAPQVDRSLQLAVIDVRPLEDAAQDFLLDGKRPPLDLIMPLAFVNPKIEYLPSPSVAEDEGCLSFPDLRGAVARPQAIRMTYQDPDGAAHVLEAGGWFARVVQHEYDHLQGKLHIDYFSPRDRKATARKAQMILRETERRRGGPLAL